MIRIGCNIRVPELVDLDEDEDHHDVHHCGIKLQADVARADMEDGTEDSLHDHADPHGVEQAVLLGKSNPPKMICFCSVFFRKKQGFQPDQYNEDHAIDDVPNVAYDMVKVIKNPPWPRASII